MLKFAQPNFSDKEYIDHIMAIHRPMGCDFSFAQLWQWSDVYKTELCRVDDGIIIRMHSDGKEIYLLPMRGESLRNAVSLLLEENETLTIVSVEKDQCSQIVSDFPNIFSVNENRDHFDYIYRASDLIELSGKKYHAKRNHIARFMREYPNAIYEPVDERNVELCIETTSVWLEQSEQTPELIAESQVIVKTLRNLKELGLVGGIIKVGETPVAVSVGAPMSENLYVIHFEKALKAYPGAYALINREFAKANCSEYEYINREEDLGSEGLRKAKLSYYPEFLVEKYTLQKGDRVD